MDQQNRKEQQVWQRVLAGQETGARQELRQLQREAMELAAMYWNLTGQLTGKSRELAYALYMGEKSNAQMLSGIGILSRQEAEQLKLWQPGKEAVQKTLQLCYHRTRRCLTEYLSRSAEGEYGVVFRALANREEQHCALLTQLLGSLG